MSAVAWATSRSPVAVLVPDTPVDADDWSLPGFGLTLGTGVPVGLAEGVGRWLLRGVPARVVGPDADLRGYAGLLVMGDGSASRTDKAPGHLHAGARAFDDAVVTALEGGDARALADLDAGLAAEVLAAGAPAWRAVGRAIGTVDEATVDLATDPYGVLYVVARWTAQWADPA